MKKSDYQEYLRSVWWQGKRKSRLIVANNQCEYCPPVQRYKDDYIRGERCTSRDDLQVHHLHYETLGQETDDDLLVLCNKHHLLYCMMDLKCEFCDTKIFDEETALARVATVIQVT